MNACFPCSERRKRALCECNYRLGSRSGGRYAARVVACVQLRSLRERAGDDSSERYAYQSRRVLGERVSDRLPPLTCSALGGKQVFLSLRRLRRPSSRPTQNCVTCLARVAPRQLWLSLTSRRDRAKSICCIFYALRTREKKKKKKFPCTGGDLCCV